MRKLVPVIALVSMFSFKAFAQGAEEKEMMGLPKDHPCQELKAACEAAGFKKGAAKEGKGLFVNCMKPILGGQSVAGVNADAAKVSACNARKAAKHK